MLAISGQMVKFGYGAGLVGDLGNILMKGFGVLNRGRKGVIPVMQLSEQVFPLRAEFPGWPCMVWVIHVLGYQNRKPWRGSGREIKSKSRQECGGKGHGV
jgi:hypothetical protein